MDRADWLTKQLKRFDPTLYCEKHRDGKLCVYRTSKRWESFRLDDGSILTVARSTPYFILALTHNWRFDGVPVEWGYLPITDHLRMMDGWNRDLAEEAIRQQELFNEKKDREAKHQAEVFAHEMRPAFKKAFSDINTANMAKKDRRRGSKWEL